MLIDHASLIFLVADVLDDRVCEREVEGALPKRQCARVAANETVGLRRGSGFAIQVNDEIETLRDYPLNDSSVCRRKRIADTDHQSRLAVLVTYPLRDDRGFVMRLATLYRRTARLVIPTP